MASDAPFIHLNAPFKIHFFALKTFLVTFLDLPICAVIKECALEKKYTWPKNYEIWGLLLKELKKGEC